MRDVFEGLYPKERPKELGRVVEALMKKNKGRIQALKPYGESLRFQVRFPRETIKVVFSCDDVPLARGLPAIPYVQIVCRDQYGLWDNTLEEEGKMVWDMHYMGVVPNAAQGVGEYEEILPENLFDQPLDEEKP